MPVKRTALGRRANEGAWPSIPTVVGRPLAFYIGCDSRGEYVYKFVSRKNSGWPPTPTAPTAWLSVPNTWMKAPSTPPASMPTGTGTWLKLDLTNPDVAAGVPVSAQNPAGYTFDSLADICVNTRLAADAAKCHPHGPPRVDCRQSEERRNLHHDDGKPRPRQRDRGCVGQQHS